MAQSRTFEDAEAVRQQVPLLVGLFGPSGSGKTFSALRLAQGIQSVVGGDIYVVDTESRRALHYADRFKFRHVPFAAPFSSLDYLAALEHCVKKGAKTIVVDSMSHEHEGVGGYLMTQEAELDRIAGQDEARRKKATYSAWILPAKERRRFINGVLGLNANFIFCFRAKDKLKIKGGGAPEELGYMPIAGEEFLFEMTVNALLLPGAGGVPTWRTSMPGERKMLKNPEQFHDLFRVERPLSEDIGRNLAQWALGGAVEAQEKPKPTLFDVAREKARLGAEAYQEWRGRLNERHLEALAEIESELQDLIAKVGTSFRDPDASAGFGETRPEASGQGASTSSRPAEAGGAAPTRESGTTGGEIDAGTRARGHSAEAASADRSTAPENSVTKSRTAEGNPIDEARAHGRATAMRGAVKKLPAALKGDDRAEEAAAWNAGYDQAVAEAEVSDSSNQGER